MRSSPVPARRVKSRSRQVRLATVRQRRPDGIKRSDRQPGLNDVGRIGASAGVDAPAILTWPSGQAVPRPFGAGARSRGAALLRRVQHY